MKIFKNFILTLCLCLFSVSLKADFVDTTSAKEVALNYLIVSSKATSNSILNHAHTEYANGFAVFYVFNIDYSSHIIVAADDRIRPILAYIPQNTYIINNDNPGFAWFVEKQKGYFVDSVINSLTPRKLDRWDFYENRNTQNLNISLVVKGPLLNSGWGQFGCYADVTRANTAPGIVTGCVATATAF